MYWVDLGTDKIQRADLNGSKIQDLVTSGLVSPRRIALDLVTGKIYWTEGASVDSLGGTIWRADLDGSHSELVIQHQNTPSGLAIDAAGGKVYWSNFLDVGGSFSERIFRANLDGTGIETITPQFFSGAYVADIALDVQAGKMYWLTGGGEGIIRRANLDGSGIEKLLTVASDFSSGDIALDPSAGLMYWTDESAAAIRRAQLDGSGVENLITSGLLNPRGLDVIPVIAAVPEPASVVAWLVLGGIVVLLATRQRRNAGLATRLPLAVSGQ